MYDGAGDEGNEVVNGVIGEIGDKVELRVNEGCCELDQVPTVVPRVKVFSLDSAPER